MNTVFALFLAIIPVIVILLFAYKSDKTKEPFILLMLLFGSGIISCFLVFFISHLMSGIPFMQDSSSNIINLLLYSFIGVALVEEICKWIMVYFIGYNNKEFDEIYDIIVYSVFVSLGFAFFENILYVIMVNDTPIKTAFIRAISAIPSHACDAIFMGYYLSLARQYFYRGLKKIEKKYILLSIIIPAILHGIYDFCVLSNYDVFIYVFIMFIVFLYIISINKLRVVAKSSKKINVDNNYCGVCGARIIDNVCPRCGKKL